MVRRHLAIALLLTFASVIALFWGLLRAHTAHGIIFDSRMAYVGARCLVQHRDLYNEAELMRVYLAEGGVLVATQEGRSLNYLVAAQLYPPTAELFFVPFALLPWRTAYVLWIGMIVVMMTLSAFLMWKVAETYAPDPPFYLACIVLVNSGILFSGGNPAGIAVSLCIIGVWCILHERFQILGVLCMAISLAVKPHDGGLIWLYLLLLGGMFRKRAIQALSVVAVIGIFAVAWISQVSPHWIQETRSNLVQYSTNGSYNDPAGNTATIMVNLQPAIAVFRNEPHFYNGVAYAICAPLLLVWMFVTVRGRRTAKEIWIGLAAIAVLSLLPVYHRPHDAKILLLTLPACAALWAEGGTVARMALGFTGAGILVTSDLPLALISQNDSASLTASGFRSEVVLMLTTRPASLVLLAVSIFYLSVYVMSYLKQNRAPIAMASSEELG